MPDTFSLLVLFILLIQAAWVLASRLLEESERQRIINRPLKEVYITNTELEAAPARSSMDSDTFYFTRFRRSYTYFLGDKKCVDRLIAPGSVVLSEEQMNDLRAAFGSTKRFYAYVDPEGKERTYLTAGPPLLSWWFIAAVFGVIWVVVLISLFISHPFIFVLLFGAGGATLEALKNSHFGEDLRDYLQPVDQELVLLDFADIVKAKELIEQRITAE
ncbi:MAG: hypothetical protein AAGF89_04255 [Bacteroidota bacterium]